MYLTCKNHKSLRWLDHKGHLIFLGDVSWLKAEAELEKKQLQETGSWNFNYGYNGPVPECPCAFDDLTPCRKQSKAF